MKIKEIAEKVQENNATKLEKMNKAKIAFIIREALSEIKKEIINEETDMTSVSSFGFFKQKTMQKEDGEDTIIKKRIIFQPAKNK